MPRLKIPDYTPVGILCSGGHSENRAMPHWCWVSDFCPFGFEKPATSWVADSMGYRYGFNNMEKDDELKGLGNSYDFGARIYDPRVGRLLSIDPIYRSFPSESNFIFAGNNPVFFIDFKGEFKWKNSDFANQYPMITLYLSKYIEEDIKNNPVILNALIKYGNATQQQVEFGIHWGNLPAIDVYSGSYAKGYYERGSNQEGVLNHYFTLNAEYLKSLEDKLIDPNLSEEEKQKALLDVYSTILDEYTHYLENLNSLYKPEASWETIPDYKGNPTPVIDQGTKTQITIFGGEFNTSFNAGEEHTPCNDNSAGCVPLDYVLEKGENLPTIPK